jgi:hypothetical protein
MLRYKLKKIWIQMERRSAGKDLVKFHGHFCGGLVESACAPRVAGRKRMGMQTSKLGDGGNEPRKCLISINC